MAASIMWLQKVILSYLLHLPGLLIHLRKGCPNQGQEMGLVLELCPSMLYHQSLQGVAEEWENLQKEE